MNTWVESHATWRSPATRRNVIAILLAAFNYAQAEHDVIHPLGGLKKPPPQPRLHSLSKEDEELLLARPTSALGIFSLPRFALVCGRFANWLDLTADHVGETKRGMMWGVFSSKTKKIRKIPVRLEVAQLIRRLMKTAPKGSGIPLLRNTQGHAWKPVTGRGRFSQIKAKLGWDKDPIKRRYSCYSCRHTFAHRMLSGYWNGGTGCSIETLAELLGDTPKVAFDHLRSGMGTALSGAAVDGGWHSIHRT